MKTKTCIVLTSLMMVFSCTVNEDADAPELETTSLKSKSPVMEILSKEGGKKALSSFFTPGNAAKGNGNGIIFFENQGDLVICGGGGPENLVCVYEIMNEFYSSPIDVTILPNGEAQFQAQSKNFMVEVYSPDLEELLYSNLCMEDKSGILHVNLKAPYLMETVFGIDVYFPDFANASSANNFQLNTMVDDAARNRNIFNEFPGLFGDVCVDPTKEKKLKVTSLFTPGGNANIKIKLN